MLNDFPVIDGFTLRRDLRCNYTLLSMALDQFERLRRVGNFKQKQWAFPRNPISEPVPAYDSAEKAIRVGIGAVIWGYQISGPTATDVENSATISGFQVRDSCTDEALFSEPHTTEFSLWPGDAVGFNGPILLPRLLVIGAPGIITLELMTQSGFPVHQQIVLYGGVPVGVDQ